MLTKPRTPTTYKHYISVPGGEGKREYLKEKQAVKIGWGEGRVGSLVIFNTR